MQAPYTEIGPDLFRPMLPLLVAAAGKFTIADGLLDTGADRTILTPRVAQVLGIDLTLAGAPRTMQTASGQSVSCVRVPVLLGLTETNTRIWWQAEVAVATVSITKSHWGFRGFLEHFRAEFDGPNRAFTLTAGPSLPTAAAPF